MPLDSAAPHRPGHDANLEGATIVAALTLENTRLPDVVHQPPKYVQRLSAFSIGRMRSTLSLKTPGRSGGTASP
jgi:hypothetical protein